MECPHCHEQVKYRERSNFVCSKCRKEFAFDPKYDPLKLHDVRFNRIVNKISDYDKFYFTPGQLMYFLNRGKIVNSARTARNIFLFLAIAFAVATAVTITTVVVPLLIFPFSIIFWILTIVYWNKEGRLSLASDPRLFQENVIRRWERVYGKPPLSLRNNLEIKHEPKLLNHPRGFLVCPDKEILACLAANHIPQSLGLILIPPSNMPKPEADAFHKNGDLPIFILHDASADGCELKDKFARIYSGSSPNRKIFDIGLRPSMVIKSKAMRLRESEQNLLTDLPGLTPEEKNWLRKGYYTPLLALKPKQLINFVKRAVTRRQELLAKNAKPNEQQAAEVVGFMTWLEK